MKYLIFFICLVVVLTGCEQEKKTSVSKLETEGYHRWSYRRNGKNIFVTNISRKFLPKIFHENEISKYKDGESLPHKPSHLILDCTRLNSSWKPTESTIHLVYWGKDPKEFFVYNREYTNYCDVKEDITIGYTECEKVRGFFRSEKEKRSEIKYFWNFILFREWIEKGYQSLDSHP